MSLVVRMGGLALHLFLCFLSLQISEMVQSYVLVSSLSKSFNMMIVCVYLKIYTYVNLPTKDNYSLRLPFHGWHNIQCDTQAVRVEAHFYQLKLKKKKVCTGRTGIVESVCVCTFMGATIFTNVKISISGM